MAFNREGKRKGNYFTPKAFFSFHRERRGHFQSALQSDITKKHECSHINILKNVNRSPSWNFVAFAKNEVICTFYIHKYHIYVIG